MAATAGATATESGRPEDPRMSGAGAGAGAPGTKRILRNRPAARRVHTGTYLVTLVLLVSGVSLLGEGIPSLEALFGGHVAAAHSHRWIGFGLIVGAGIVLLLRPGTSLRFLGESSRFRMADLRWFASYPAYLLGPARHRPARHEGDFDPGQRLFNLLVVGSLVALSTTGVLMSFPQAFVPTVFAWSVRVHRGATWALAAGVGGHVIVASGVLSAYRGVWRAMHRDGRVDRRLAETLWPRWVEEQGHIGSPAGEDASEPGA